uniref:Interleukin-7 n=1 Tax=Pavo cristatus TaxID=9049 RepID=A0A8C9EWD1_PAVCR
MLAQLTVLLALGVLCSPAPTSTPRHCSSLYSIIEVQSDVENDRVTIGLSSIPADIKNETCMRSNLKTFVESLKASQVENAKVIHQLSIVYKCDQLFLNIKSSQGSDEECRTAQDCTKPRKRHITLLQLKM